MAVELHVEVIGEGPPVVVLHGLFGAGRNWLTVARKLSARYQFMLVDLRNHGQSPHHSSMTYIDMIEDVRNLVASRQLETFTLVGHSMGGKAAMTMALNDPKYIARLINIDIGPVSYPDRFVEMIKAMRSLDLTTIQRRNQAAEALESAIPEQSVRLFVLQNLVFKQGQAQWRANLAALEDQMAHILGPLPVAKDAVFNGNTWFIRGELSDRITDEHLPLMRTLFPNHRLLTVPGGGHWPHAEAPGPFLELFEQALNSE